MASERSRSDRTEKSGEERRHACVADEALDRRTGALIGCFFKVNLTISEIRGDSEDPETLSQKQCGTPAAATEESRDPIPRGGTFARS